MTDARNRARELEARRWQGSDHEIGLLVERMRSGAMTPEKLRLAAYCDHEAANVALGLVVRRCASCGAEEENFASTCSPCLGPKEPGDDDDERCETYHEDVEDCPNAPCVSRNACGFCGSCDHLEGAEWIPSPPRAPQDMGMWLQGLSAHHDAGPVAGWVLARAALAVLDIGLHDDVLRNGRRSVRLWGVRTAKAIGAWLDCPCAAHRDACRSEDTPNGMPHHPIGACALRARSIVGITERDRLRVGPELLVEAANHLVAARIQHAANSSLLESDMSKAEYAMRQCIVSGVKSILTEWALR